MLCGLCLEHCYVVYGSIGVTRCMAAPLLRGGWLVQRYVVEGTPVLVVALLLLPHACHMYHSAAQRFAAKDTLTLSLHPPPPGVYPPSAPIRPRCACRLPAVRLSSTARRPSSATGASSTRGRRRLRCSSSLSASTHRARKTSPSGCLTSTYRKSAKHREQPCFLLVFVFASMRFY